MDPTVLLLASKLAPAVDSTAVVQMPSRGSADPLVLPRPGVLATTTRATTAALLLALLVVLLLGVSETGATTTKVLMTTTAVRATTAARRRLAVLPLGIKHPLSPLRIPAILDTLVTVQLLVWDLPPVFQQTLVLELLPVFLVISAP